MAARLHHKQEPFPCLQTTLLAWSQTSTLRITCRFSAYLSETGYLGRNSDKHEPSFVCSLKCRPKGGPSISICRLLSCLASNDTPVLGTVTFFLSVTTRGGHIRRCPRSLYLEGIGAAIAGRVQKSLPGAAAAACDKHLLNGRGHNTASHCRTTSVQYQWRSTGAPS